MSGEVLAAWWFWAVPAAFVGVLIYAFNPRRKKQFDAEARVPMDTDTPDDTKKN